MQPTSHAFKENAHVALQNPHLRQALGNMASRQGLRVAVAEALPEFDALRDQARDIKNHTLAHLDFYLERFAAKVEENGGHVHWARTPSEARDKILEICRSVDAKVVTKGKSMVAEEIALNSHLEDAGLKVVETDLGEYIIQLRNEAPSHIIGPALHLTKQQVMETFYEHHQQFDPKRSLEEPVSLVSEARYVLRQKYFEADVGITGANFLIAETGTTVIVTNEGNGDLTQTLPKIHIVLATIEKAVPTFEDVSTILRVLARSATAQEFSAYTTFSTGPRRPGDLDGPEQYHVVLLDNGRTALLGTEFQDVLRCIRCGACMNNCPVYGAVGGHAYGWVYPGPIGSVLDPALIGVKEAGHLPNASTFCGKCEAVCPMRIPLPKMMRHWREKEFEQKLQPAAMRTGIGLWAWFAKRPSLYRLGSRIAMNLMGAAGRKRGRFKRLPLAHGWTDWRDMPAPEGKTFHQMYAERRKGTGRA